LFEIGVMCYTIFGSYSPYLPTPLEKNLGDIVVTRGVGPSVKHGMWPAHKERKNTINFGSCRSMSKVMVTKRINFVSAA